MSIELNQRRGAMPARDGAAVSVWMAIAERILVLAKQFRQRLATSARTADLSETDLLALWACVAAPEGAANQRQLADRLAVSPAQVSGTVERLRQSGLLDCRRDPQDRRRQVWHLTAAGQEAIATAARDVAAWSKNLEVHLPDTAPEQLIGELDRLLAQFETAPFLREPGLPIADDTLSFRRGAA